MELDARYPDITVQLTGEDGNVFSIIGRVRRSLQRAGVSEADVTAFTNEVMASHSYDEALQTVMRWVNVE